MYPHKPQKGPQNFFYSESLESLMFQNTRRIMAWQPLFLDPLKSFLGISELGNRRESFG